MGKKKLLLPLLATLFFVVGCGGQNEDTPETPDDPTPVDPTPDQPGEHVHNGVLVPAKPHTCTEDGNIAYYHCAGCNKDFEDAACTKLVIDVVDPAAHNPVAHEKVDATCSKEGTLAYWSCSGCSKLFSDESCEHETTEEALKIAKASHSYDDEHRTIAKDGDSWKVTRTCTAEGCGYVDTQTAEPITIAALKTKINSDRGSNDPYYSGKYYVVSGYISKEPSVSVPTDGGKTGHYIYMSDSIDTTEKEFYTDYAVLADGLEDSKLLVGTKITVVGEAIYKEAPRISDDPEIVAVEYPNATINQKVSAHATAASLPENIKIGDKVDVTPTVDAGYALYNITHNGVTIPAVEGRYQITAQLSNDIIVEASIADNSNIELEAFYKAAPVELVDGAEIALVSNNKTMGSDAGNFRNVVEASVVGNRVIFGEDAVTVKLKAVSGKEGHFYLTVGEKYLGNQTTSNYLKTYAESKVKDGGCEFEFVVDEDGNLQCKIADGSTSKNWIRYNSANPRFSCYSAGQTDVDFYVKKTSTTTISCTVDSNAKHSLVGVAEVPSTCTKNGTAAHQKCEFCDKLFVTEGESLVEKKASDLVLPLAEHEFEYEHVAGENKHHKTCKNCETAFEDEACDFALDSTKSIEATVDAEGKNVYVCKYCDNSYEEAVAKIVHNQDKFVGYYYNGSTLMAQYECNGGHEANPHTETEKWATAATADQINSIVATISRTEGKFAYSSVNDAYEAAQNGEIISIVKDFDSCKFTGNKEVVLDFGGADITVTNRTKFYNGKVTLKNGSLTAAQVDVWYGAEVTIDATAEVKSQIFVKGLYVADADFEGTVGETAPTLTVNGKISVTGETACINTNGNDTTHANIIINEGAELTSANDNAIQLAADANLTVKGGTITGATGLYLKSGHTTIEKGTISGTGDKVAYQFNGNGSNPTGDAIVVDNANYPGKSPEIDTIPIDAVITSTNAEKVGTYAPGNAYEVVVNSTEKTSSKTTFNSETWGDADSKWTSNEKAAWYDDSAYGVNVKAAKTDGAGATTKDSYSNIEKIVVTYCNTNNNNTKITVSVGTYTETQEIKSNTGKGKYATLEYSPTVTEGKVTIHAITGANNLYVTGVEIFYTGNVSYKGANNTLKEFVDNQFAAVSESSERNYFYTLPSAPDGTTYSWSYAVKDSADYIDVTGTALEIAANITTETEAVYDTYTLKLVATSGDFSYTVTKDIQVRKYQLVESTVADVATAGNKLDSGKYSDGVQYKVTGTVSVESGKKYLVDGSVKVQLYENSTTETWSNLLSGDQVTVQGYIQRYNSTIEFVNPTYSNVVEKKNSVALATTENGTITIDGSKTSYRPGETCSFTVTPADGYSISEVKAGSTVLTAGEDGKFSFVPTEDTILTATFSSNSATYNITVASDSSENATVSAFKVGDTEITSGTNGTEFTFTVTPAEGYDIKSVSVNNIDVTADEGIYTATINGDTIIKVTTEEHLNLNKITLTSSDVGSQYVNTASVAKTDDSFSYVAVMSGKANDESYLQFRGKSANADSSIYNTESLGGEITSVTINASITGKNQSPTNLNNNITVEFSSSADFSNATIATGVVTETGVTYTAPTGSLYVRITNPTTSSSGHACYIVSIDIFVTAE